MVAKVAKSTPACAILVAKVCRHWPWPDPLFPNKAGYDFGGKKGEEACRR